MTVFKGLVGASDPGVAAEALHAAIVGSHGDGQFIVNSITLKRNDLVDAAVLVGRFAQMLISCALLADSDVADQRVGYAGQSVRNNW